MFNIGRRPFNNKIIRDYSLKCTNDYMRKIKEKNEIEKKPDLNNFRQEIIIGCPSNPNGDKYNMIPFIIFLSISSFIYFFSNRK
jgi:hypothetical protein